MSLRTRFWEMRRRWAWVVFFIFLGTANGLPTAESRKGATVIITLKDGHVISGEFLVVEENALVTDQISIEPGGIIDLNRIAIVQIVRKVRPFAGGVVGALVGALPYIWQEVNGEAGEYAELGLINWSLLGAGLGTLVLGSGMGVDKTVDFRDLAPDEIERALKELDGYAREHRRRRSRLALPPNNALVLKSPVSPEAPSEAKTPALLRRPRFHFIWKPGFVTPAKSNSFDVDPNSLRMWAVQPGDMAARSTRAKLSIHRREKQPFRLYGSYREQLGAMNVRMDYSLGRNLNLGLEYLNWGQWSVEFLSVWKGLEGWPDKEVGFRTLDILETQILMVGLAWKTNPVFLTGVSSLSLGVGAGLSWNRIRDEHPGSSSSYSFRRWDVDTWEGHGGVAGSLGVAFQILSGYDYFFTRKISLGFGAGYYFVQAAYPKRQASASYEFTIPDPAAGNGERRIGGTVIFTSPDRRFNLSNFHFNLRFGFHF